MLASTNARRLQGQPVSATAPTNGQALVYSSGLWAPGSVSSVLQDYETVVSAADVKQLSSGESVVLVPSPSVTGQTIIPVAIAAFLEFNTTAFAGGEAGHQYLMVGYGSTSLDAGDFGWKILSDSTYGITATQSVMSLASLGDFISLVGAGSAGGFPSGGAAYPGHGTYALILFSDGNADFTLGDATLYIHVIAAVLSSNS